SPVTSLSLFPYLTTPSPSSLPYAGAAVLGRYLAGRRCRLARVLPLQERSPLQAIALAAGLPLATSQRAAAPAAWPKVAAPYSLAAGAANARKRRPCRRQPCPWAAAQDGDCRCKGLWLWPAAPLQGAFAVASCLLQPASPWVAGPTWGLAAPPPCCLRCENAARTRRSYIPVFQIRIEKMKEVKRPPL
ncbi:hypothetical protein BHM03_00038824, partial [Ensete ventricosum]